MVKLYVFENFNLNNSYKLFLFRLKMILVGVLMLLVVLVL